MYPTRHNSPCPAPTTQKACAYSYKAHRLMRIEVGRRVHLVIAELAGTNPSRERIVSTVADMWTVAPVGGSVASSARIQCSSAVGMYVASCHPDRSWVLIGSEVRLDGAVADLVWRHDSGAIVVDELKIGAPRITEPRCHRQLTALAAGGAAKWGNAFVGVRLVPLGAVNRTRLYRLDASGQLAGVATLKGM